MPGCSKIDAVKQLGDLLVSRSSLKKTEAEFGNDLSAHECGGRRELGGDFEGEYIVTLYCRQSMIFG